jgi:phosphatidylinositol-4,5-bisphosphate 3-kinase catalytic subunit alpha/beta/delta
MVDLHSARMSATRMFVSLDLRQDMLALQFIQMIDIIWKSDGLDLRFDPLPADRRNSNASCSSLLPYGCLATGYCSGLIEVVKNAKTIMNIQKLGGLKGQFQFDASALYRWIAQNNPGTDK